MPWSGSAGSKTFSRNNGTHTGATAWQQDQAAGTGIVSDRHDTHDQDISDGLNSALLKDGGNSLAGNIPAAGFGFTGLGLLGSAVIASVASASTTDVLGASSLFVSITGTTTITSLGTGTYRWKYVRFAGSLILTHNPTSLIIPGGANITTAAGDTMIIASDGSSNVWVVSYQRADGTAVVVAPASTWTGGSNAEVTVASASTCDILGAASALVAISGTTTITSLGTGTNRVRFVRFTGILTLTHNATSLILPTGANITTAAGDTMIVESDGSSNVRVLAYQRASGQALVVPSSGVVTVKTQVFAASGTYTPSTGMLYAELVCIGAGGGGGGAAASSGSAAGGGGAGSESRKLVTASDIGASKAVTIGGGGSAGTSAPGAGGSGGDTSIGVLCVGKGGSGGAAASAAGSLGGLGGVAGTGDVAGVGMAGLPGATATNSAASGAGGSTRFGGGGRGRPNSNGAGSAASGYGAGGGGACYLSGGALAGGAGTDGLAFVIEYCSQ